MQNFFDPSFTQPGLALNAGDPTGQPGDGSAGYGYATPLDQAPPGSEMVEQPGYSMVPPTPANMLGMGMGEATRRATPILSGALLGVLGFLLGTKSRGKPKILKLLAAAGAGIATQKALAQTDGRAPGVRFAAAAGAGWLAGRVVK